MKRVIAKNGRAALIILACSLAASSSRADAPVSAKAAAVLAAAPVESARVEPPATEVRDRLMEIVFEYLDVAFVHESRDSRTANLQASNASASILQ